MKCKVSHSVRLYQTDLVTLSRIEFNSSFHQHFGMIYKIRSSLKIVLMALGHHVICRTGASLQFENYFHIYISRKKWFFSQRLVKAFTELLPNIFKIRLQYRPIKNTQTKLFHQVELNGG